jgi:hypothetical protein
VLPAGWMRRSATASLSNSSALLLSTRAPSHLSSDLTRAHSIGGKTNNGAFYNSSTNWQMKLDFVLFFTSVGNVNNFHFKCVYSSRGVVPFQQRKKLWDRHRAKSKKTKGSGAAHASDVLINSQVCMKSCPMYQAGAIGKINSHSNICCIIFK